MRVMSLTSARSARRARSESAVVLSGAAPACVQSEQQTSSKKVELNRGSSIGVLKRGPTERGVLNRCVEVPLNLLVTDRGVLNCCTVPLGVVARFAGSAKFGGSESTGMSHGAEELLATSLLDPSCDWYRVSVDPNWPARSAGASAGVKNRETRSAANDSLRLRLRRACCVVRRLSSGSLSWHASLQLCPICASLCDFGPLRPSAMTCLVLPQIQFRETKTR